MKTKLLDRFLSYVKINTQSDSNSTSEPSTQGQLEIATRIQSELYEVGISHRIYNGYVYANIPSNSTKEIPAIGFIAHLDTVEDESGENIQPIIYTNYQGEDIILPHNNISINRANNPELSKVIGHTLVTADGRTLLGADDKAGVSILMELLIYFHTHPEIEHGDIYVVFTPDEEIGKSMDKFSYEDFPVKYAYTLDGDYLGNIEVETFNALNLNIEFTGVVTHPGYGKGVYKSSMDYAIDFIKSIPEKYLPQNSSNSQDLIFVNSLQSTAATTKMELRVRSFNIDSIKKLRSEMIMILSRVAHNKSSFTETTPYYNIGNVISHTSLKTLEQAMKNIGIEPIRSLARGGTDGCSFVEKGKYVPNVFCGQHNLHSKTEWCSIEEMVKSFETLVELCKIIS